MYLDVRRGIQEHTSKRSGEFPNKAALGNSRDQMPVFTITPWLESMYRHYPIKTYIFHFPRACTVEYTFLYTSSEKQINMSWKIPLVKWEALEQLQLCPSVFILDNVWSHRLEAFSLEDLTFNYVINFSDSTHRFNIDALPHIHKFCPRNCIICWLR